MPFGVHHGAKGTPRLSVLEPGCTKNWEKRSQGTDGEKPCFENGAFC